MPADRPSNGLDEWKAFADMDKENTMVNRALMTMQDKVNAFVDRRPGFWKTNAIYVGSLSYLSLGDGVEKLKAQLRNLTRHHRMTTLEALQMRQISLGLALVSPRPTKSRHRTQRND